MFLSSKRPKNILDEDEYLDDLEYIIKRDFFPDSDLIELQLKYYDALDIQDFSAIKEIQLKLNKINQSFDNIKSINDDSISVFDDKPYKNPNERKERDFHLEQYLARNTSEDNQSYNDLQQKSMERQLKRLSAAFKAAKEYNESRYKSIKSSSEIKSIAFNNNDNNQYKEDKSVDLSAFMEYKVFNPVFFNPESAPLSKEERITLAGKKSEIVYENTRFIRPLSNRVRKTNNKGGVKSTLYNIPGKIGHDGKEIYDGKTPRVGGFSILCNSSETPDSVAEPDMTWGEIGGTPYLLAESPLTAASQFKMHGPSEREKIANDLASRSSRKNRENKQQALQRVRSSLIGSSYSRSHSMSPAALKLLSRMTPSGFSSRPGSSLASQRINTPHSLRTDISRKPTPNVNITDNLLDI